MKNSIILITLLCTSLSAIAENIYVTDSIKFTLKQSEDSKSKVIKMVSSGTRLTKVSENPATGYSLVRTKKGLEGYILTRHLSKKPISKWYLQQTQKELDSLQQKHNLISDELNQLKSGNTESNTDLAKLQKTANEATQLKFEKDQLQQRVSSVERELEQVKRDNQGYKDSEKQDMFLYGGLLSLFGVILGFLLPKLGWSRKQSSWDNF